MTENAPLVEDRARQSLGKSSRAIHAMVVRALDERGASGGVLVDIGCGTGTLRHVLGSRFNRYVGIDAVRYDELPSDVEFHRGDLDGDGLPLPPATGDVVVAVETIEHLENPRKLIREMVRLTRAGGHVVVTTPNQLSWLSLATLITKGHYSAFQDTSYPAHLTALLERDLLRIFGECGLQDVQTRFTMEGRIVLTPLHYPRLMARMWPRRLSDNILVTGRVPA